MKKNYLTDFIKFFAAILVIFSHSFAISKNDYDFFERYTDGYVNLGGLAVAILFAISGYYIMKSLDKKGTKKFIKKRILRLVPSLAVVVILCIIVLGLFFSDMSAINYLSNLNTYKYLLNIFFIPIHYLPGVFTNNIYGSTVNGALWTMIVQFLCYIYVYIAYIIKLAKRENINYYLLFSFFLGICGLLLFNYLKIKVIIAMIRPFLCFVFGGYLYYSKAFNKKLFITSIIFSVICLIVDNYLSINSFLIICVTYIIIYLCENYEFVVKNKIVKSVISSSYELYLVGFPIQQALVSLNGGTMSIFYNFTAGLSLAVVFSVIIEIISKKINELFKF